MGGIPQPGMALSRSGQDKERRTSSGKQSGFTRAPEGYFGLALAIRIRSRVIYQAEEAFKKP